MGPTWVLSAPDGPHVGPMNLAIRDCYYLFIIWMACYGWTLSTFPKDTVSKTAVVCILQNLFILVQCNFDNKTPDYFSLRCCDNAVTFLELITMDTAWLAHAIITTPTVFGEYDHSLCLDRCVRNYICLRPDINKIKKNLHSNNTKNSIVGPGQQKPLPLPRITWMIE